MSVDRPSEAGVWLGRGAKRIGDSRLASQDVEITMRSMWNCPSTIVSTIARKSVGQWYRRHLQIPNE